MLGIAQTYYLMHCFEEGVNYFDCEIRAEIEGSCLKIQVGQSKRWGKSHGNGSFNVCCPSK